MDGYVPWQRWYRIPQGWGGPQQAYRMYPCPSWVYTLRATRSGERLYRIEIEIGILLPKKVGIPLGNKTSEKNSPNPRNYSVLIYIHIYNEKKIVMQLVCLLIPCWRVSAWLIDYKFARYKLLKNESDNDNNTNDEDLQTKVTSFNKSHWH